MSRIDACDAAAGQGRIDVPPTPAAIAHYPGSDAPCFLVFVDTEEEFDWQAPLRRDGHGTSHVHAIPAMQAFLEARRVSPVYLVDQPIAESSDAVEILRSILERGACAIGTQLHPWVSPPFEEELISANSFAGNLPEALERAKIVALTELIARQFGQRPWIYRAGRYGIGPRSARILTALGYRLDVSVRPGFDYSAEGGPDFSNFGPDPFWSGAQDTLLELPLTTAFIGTLRGQGRRLNRLTNARAWLRGAFARSGMFSRVPLTPEGVSIAEAKEAIRVMAGEGVSVFSLSFHSPSLVPGHTAYVRDAEELKMFYQWWDEVIALFDRLGVHPARVEDFFEAMVAIRQQAL